MNHCYRLVFNKSTHVWQAVSEMAKSHSKSAVIVLLPILSLLCNSNAWAELALNALPNGGQVVSGQSSITQNGNQLNIVQSTQKSIINWDTYNIGANAQVNYVQNNAHAISLNRVTSGNPSEILGKLSANGQVWLINPNGVLFGQGAQVNVGGLLASTLNIADEDFLSGRYQFNGRTGSVINSGSIASSNGGYVALLAPDVRNEGVISAMQGSAVMAAGSAMTLDFEGNGLINVQVDSASVNTLIENKHLIQVGSGQVLMSTKAADGLMTSVINNTGKIEANGMVSDGGVIRLTGAKTVINSGEISATSANQKGGTVHLLGENVGLFDSGSVNVSGGVGGGTILIGGDYQGKNLNTQNASKTFIHQDAQLIADATVRGDGGKVIVWANDVTRYYGSVSAKGGTVSGDGGFVEISGKRLLNFLGNVDLSAANGAGGHLLLDPTNILLISGTAANTTGFTAGVDNTQAFADDAGLDSVFNVGAGGSFAGVAAGSTITLQATNDITVVDAFNVGIATGSANNSLVLEANNNININAALTLDGAGALTVKADADNSGAGDVVIAANISTQTGGLTLSGHNITRTAGNISTMGAVDTDGGNVNMTATEAINLASASIITTAGSASTGNVGRNAGNVTLNAGSFVQVGAISASGSIAGSSGQNGGNGGVINITAHTGVGFAGIIASGNRALGGNAKGGDGGIININNTATGDIIGQNIDTRTGNSAGSGDGGIAGSINVNNQANAGNVTLGTITANGGTKGNGANVTISALANVNLISTINTSGGAMVAGAGRHAGNITITGVDRNIVGTISANGGAAVGADQAGGNAGVVSITGAGSLSHGAINVKTGNANGSGTGGLAGSVSLSGSQITSTAIDTSPGANGVGGHVSISTTGNGNSTVASINASNLGVININNTDRLTVGGAIQGIDTAVTKSGSGALVYAGTNTYTGLTTVNAGALEIGDGATSGSLVNNGGIVNHATVIFNRADAHAYAGAVDGSGNIEKEGGGVFTFSGSSNAYTGETNIKAGTFINNNAISNVSAVSVLSGATLDLNNQTTVVGSIAGSGSIEMGTASLTSGGNSTSTLFSGVINGIGGSFNKSGSGTLTLSGNNTYTGVTNVQAGTLSAAHANALGAVAGGTHVASGGVLNVNNVTLAAEAITLADAATLTGTDSAVVIGNVSAGDNSQVGTTSVASSLTITGVLTSLAGNTLEIIGAGSLIAANAANNVDIVKITSANNVTLHDRDSLRFSTTASNLMGHLTVNAADNITMQAGGGITSTTGNIALTSNAFINHAGSDALTAAGRWVVHTDTLAGNIYGALNSANQAIYGRALGVETTEAGNRYVFVQSPTLNISSINQAKTYGDDATTAVANAYTAATFVDATAYGNVFTQDTIANSLTGSATSVGSTTASNVGSYAIDVTAVNATNGYTLTKTNTGNLTVNAAVINLAATRVYDATTEFDAGLFGVINGVNGQTLSLTGVGQVASKNVGTQTLTLGSLALGDDTGLASNYTLATGTHTGAITAATLDLNAVTDTKVYDGGTDSTGVVTVVGLVGGDTVSGLSQSYASKNVLGTNGSALSVNTGFTVNDGNGGNNYTVSLNSAVGTISPSALTIQANGATKIQGEANPTFSSSFTGFVGGDTAAVLNGALGYATLANATSPVGSYTVTPFGVTADNYNIAFVDGVLAVTAFIAPEASDAFNRDVSVFNNAVTRPDQAVQNCSQTRNGTAMINGLDAFGVDAVDYQPSISQPTVGGVVANALTGSSCT